MHIIKNNYFLAFILLLFAVKLAGAQDNKREYIFRPFVLVELFSSEGCSNCPPADSLLHKLKDDADRSGLPIYFVDYHVQLWDDGGWVDPFATEQFSERQQVYNTTFNEDGLYTPEMVVNGATAFVGSDDLEADNAMSLAMEEPASFLIDIKKDSLANDTLYVHYTASRADTSFTVNVILVESGLRSEIKGGDNEGLTVYHENVCRALQSKILYNRKGQIKIPLHKMMLNKNYEMIGFVQQNETFKIVGACMGDLDFLLAAH